jgi:riboflavin kinase/FMN adenylyltransferase
MRILRSLDEVPSGERGRAIALGTFDGVHVGHRRVIEAAVAHARSVGDEASVVTFEPHPGFVLHPKRAPKLICSFDVKAERIEALGADELIAIPFTESFSRMTADAFCDEVLVGALNVLFVSVGANFRFGHDAHGSTETLAGRSEFETEVVELVELGDRAVSSSRIRALIEAGEVSEAAQLLGDWFSFEGEVVPGAERGRGLGVPTANIVPDPERAVPGRGVYAARAQLAGGEYVAAVNVGTRPTFEADGKLLVEAHLIDFTGELYGARLRLEFVERLRDERRFASAEELVAQMQRDIGAARRLLSPAAK